MAVPRLRLHPRVLGLLLLLLLLGEGEGQCGRLRGTRLQLNPLSRSGHEGLEAGDPGFGLGGPNHPWPLPYCLFCVWWRRASGGWGEGRALTDVHVYISTAHAATTIAKVFSFIFYLLFVFLSFDCFLFSDFLIVSLLILHDFHSLFSDR